ncbi:MAG: membrane lipoprotein lipid attachment site-containing protein [bacterium]|nr:membrane lipoprotein lipid attachment site-containing protein [bacterium]
MKKIILFLTIIFLFTGCEKLLNTPTKQVEALFNKYQTVDTDIQKEINEYLANEELTEEERKRYYKVIENQYKNLVYDIKEEEINGDEAVVTTEIEVLDYKTASETNQTNASKLEALEKTKEKVKYTLYINVLKENGNWKVNYLTTADRKKIQGMY